MMLTKFYFLSRVKVFLVILFWFDTSWILWKFLSFRRSYLGGYLLYILDGSKI